MAPAASPVLNVSEWAELRLPPQLDKPLVKARLLRAASSAAGDALQMRRGRIFAAGLVGLVATRDLRVQILPKVFGDSDPSRGLSLLQNMLQLESGVSGEISPALVSSVQGDLLEFMIFQLATRLRRQLDHGVPRRYFEHSEDLETIRGRVDLGRLSRSMPGGRIRVPVTHSPLQRDNNLSRMIRATVAALYSKTRVWSTRKLLSSCDSSLINVKLHPLTLELIESAEPNMLEEDWRWIFEIALLFSRGGRADPLSAGSENQFSIIFSLHGLFERAIRRVFAGHLPGGICLSARKSIGYLMRALPSGNQLLNLQPDLVFGRGGPPLLVGDAKWRIRRSDSIGRNDAYQLASYIFHSNAEAGVLFYPSESPTSGGVKMISYKYTRDERPINVVEVDVEMMCGSNKIIRAEISSRLRQLVADMISIGKVAD